MEKRKAVVSSGATFPYCFAPNAHNKMCLCPRIQEWLKERKIERQRRWGEKEKGGKRRMEGNAGQSGGSSLKPEKPPKAAASLRAERGVAHFSSDMNLQQTEVCWKNG